MSSVASDSSAVQFFHPLPAPRGPSAGADNAGEHTTPFAMLLDANNPAAPLSPAPCFDRPARSESAPQRRDDLPPADEQRADARPPSAPQDDVPNANGGNHAATGSDNDFAKASEDTATTNDNSQVSANDGIADQAAVNSPGANAQITFAQIVIGPAVAPVTLAGDATPAQPVASPNAATVAITATSLASPPVADQSTADDHSASAGNPESAKNHALSAAWERVSVHASDRAKAVLAALADIAASTTPAASVESTTDESATQTAPGEPSSNAARATPATPATPAQPAKKSELTGQTESAETAENAMRATPATPAQPAQKAAPIADAAPAGARASDNSQDENGPAQNDSPSTNANPNALAALDEAAENDGTKPELAADNGKHLGTELKSNARMVTDTASQIVEPALTSNRAETVQLPAPALPAVVNAAMPANAAPPPIAAAAIPLAGVPIEIAAQAKDGNHRFEIRLDPPELGRIDVRLDIDRNGHVTSRLMADRPETLDLLRRDAPQIERALQDAGLKTSNQGLQFSLRDQSFAQQNDDSLPVAAKLVLPADAIVPLEAMRHGYGRMIGLGGGIDIRV